MENSFGLLFDIAAAVLTSLFIINHVAVHYLGVDYQGLHQTIGNKIREKRSLMGQKVAYLHG